VSQQIVLGKDGVRQIYPTAQGGTEFYLNMDDPYKVGSGHNNDSGQFNISYGHGSQFPFTKHTEGGLTFFNTEGSPITYASGSKPGRSTRLDVYPAGGKWNNKTKYSWKSNPGFLYTADSIGSGEFTLYVRTHGDLGTHQAYACKIGGRDEDDLRSLIEMVYPTASHSDVQVNINYAHFPYVNVKPKIVNAPPKLVEGKWIGVKCVHKIAADKKSGDWELWYDDSPFDASGKPANNWKLAATYHDVGVKQYGNVPLTWKCHKDLARIDGFKNVDFTLISDREITTTAAAEPVPAPTPTPQPEPEPTPTPTPEPTPEPSPSVGDEEERELTVSAATASGDDGNKPANTLDGNSATRWSCQGKGSYITFELSATYHVTDVAIAWYEGDTRSSDFEISLGHDSSTFSSALVGKSSGTTTQPEIYQLLSKSADAKFVKITVNGNTRNDWASITEVKIYGTPARGGDVPVTPMPPPAPTPEPVPPTTTTETLDAFGVQKVYADLPAPYRQWHHTSVDDPLYYEQKPKLVSGSGLEQWLTFPKLTQGRIEVLPMPGLKDSDIETFDYSKVIKKGYLHLPRDDPSGNGDWGDIEMTIAIRNAVPGSGSFESHFEFVRGGFRQTNDETLSGKDKAIPASCQAMSIHSNIYPKPGSDRTKFEKDTRHTPCYTAHDPEFKNAPSKAGIDQVKGYIFKTVYHRIADPSQNGGYAMRMEQYASTDGLEGKKFTRMSEFEDRGKWGPCRKAGSAKPCGCPDEYPIHSMDICCPGIRIDFFKSFEFGKFSIRSIDPKKKLAAV